MENFNKLSAAEAERLAILSEELGEIQQEIGKILRHGYERKHPKAPSNKTNRFNLEVELGDLQAILSIMANNLDISLANIDANKEVKLKKINKYLHHNSV
jgi:NTP pyrophosphatase (non-canonical NTP hydrolase)